MDSIDKAPGIRPRPTLGRRLDALARSCFPSTCTILLMLLVQLPFGFPDQAQLLPAVTLSSVWFWSLFRPASMPPPVVFVIGILLDLMGYLPLGVGVLGLLLTHAIALRGRRALAGQGFLLVWLVFIAIALLIAALTWLLTSLLLFRFLAMAPAVFQFVVSVTVYPAIALMFVRAHRSLADPSQA